MTRFARFALVAVALVAALAMPRRAAAQQYTIVVNAANPTATLSRDQAAMLFLKQKLTWSDGQRVVPVDLAKSNATRAVFTKEVLGRTLAAVNSYWQGQIFAGGAQPPAERPSDAEVLAFVRSTPNAIGYVSAGSALPDGVKAVALR